MDVRDAKEADAEQLATLADTPPDVMRNLIHDRTVRVAEADEEILGFISYDAREQTVHVTQVKGETAVCERLLDEPLRFAHTEGMTVELLVPADEPDVEEAVRSSGFEEAGPGPQFEGVSTTRFRLD
jgi:hypothetical protein